MRAYTEKEVFGNFINLALLSFGIGERDGCSVNLFCGVEKPRIVSGNAVNSEAIEPLWIFAGISGSVSCQSIRSCGRGKVFRFPRELSHQWSAISICRGSPVTHSSNQCIPADHSSRPDVSSGVIRIIFEPNLRRHEVRCSGELVNFPSLGLLQVLDLFD